MATKQYDNYADLITFTRASTGTALRHIGYGAELVTNGTFDTDISGWANISPAGGSIAWNAAGYLDLINTTNTAVAFQPLNLTKGNVYQLVVENKGGGTVFVYDQQNVSPFTNVALGEVSAGQTRTFIYVEAFDDNGITLQNFSAGTTVSLDNVSVKKVIFDRATDPLVLFNHPTNTPRIEYDASGNRKGLLIEEARTNLFDNSEAFNTWASTNTVVTPNVAIAPNGTLTADKVAKTNTTVSGWVNIGEPTPTGVLTASFYAKAGEYDTVEFTLFNGTDGHMARAKVSLLDGSITNNFDGAVTSVFVGNGWWRIAATGTTTQTYNQFYIYPNLSGVYQGDGTSGIYVWGAQLEAGSFPTSYIPTAGSTATRAADVASIPTSAFGYNQKAGTVVVEAIGSQDGFAGVAALQNAINDATSRISILQTFAVSYETLISVNSVIQLQQFKGGFNVGSTYKVGITFSENNSVSSFAGSLETVDTSCSIPLDISTLAIGYYGSSVQLNGHIKSIQYYPRRLTNTQLQELTS